MPDNKEQSQPRDYFSQYIQQQLKSHRLTPDEACWEEIGLRLRRRRNRLILRRSLYIAGAAVLALLLWVGIPASEETTSHYAEVIEEIAISDIKEEKLIDNPVIAITDEKTFYQSPVVTIPEESKQEEIMEITSGNKPETVSETETETEKEIKKEETSPVVNEKKKKTELPVLPDKPISLPHHTKQKRNWQVSAGLLALGNSSLGNLESPSSQNDYQHLPNDGNGWIPSPPDYGIPLQPDNCDDISYNLPLSFGITARKDLGRKLSLETGLVYTYLSTNLKKNSPNMIKGKLGLHYLGIPVNLIVGLWDDSRWDVYASGGIMVEKGLRSVYNQQVYRTGAVDEATVKTSISGVQWSLNGAIGVSYRLYRDWSLYAEPRVSYFFDNNQPISVRADKPLTLGFGFGVRFDF